MIHTLQINADTSHSGYVKLARKLAMTGGFELELAEDLSSTELKKLYEEFSLALPKFQTNLASDFYNSGAYRICILIQKHRNCSKELAKLIIEDLGHHV